MDSFNTQRLNTAKQLLEAETIQAYQQELIIKDAEVLTGDDSIDRDLKRQAETARRQLLAVQRRITVRKEEIERLTTEIQAEEEAARGK